MIACCVIAGEATQSPEAAQDERNRRIERTNVQVKMPAFGEKSALGLGSRVENLLFAGAAAQCGPARWSPPAAPQRLMDLIRHIGIWLLLRLRAVANPKNPNFSLLSHLGNL